MPTQLLAIARNAFVESIRQPFYVVWLAVVGFLITINPYLSAYTFEDDDKLATDMGLSMLLIGALFMAAFTASGVVSREIENKTALTVISKPIARPTFVLGKYLGVAAALGMAWWVWSLLHLLAMRQGAFTTQADPWDKPVLIFGAAAIVSALAIALGSNYFFSKHFGALFARWLAVLLPLAVLAVSPFDHEFHVQSPLHAWEWPELLAVMFILQSTVLFAAIAVTCSTRLGQVSTLTVMIVVFFMGLTSDYAFGRLAEDHTETFQTDTGATAEREVAGVLWAKTVYAAVPNLQFHWLSDALTQGTAYNITSGFIVNVTTYTLILIVGVLALGVALFQTRQAA